MIFLEVFWHPNKEHTVDGRNPANQLMGSLSRYLPGFIYISQVVVWDFSHQQYLHECPDGQLIIGFLRGW